MKRQLRLFYSPEARAALYASTYQHEKWEDHRHRVAHTAQLLKEMNPLSVADLSCGDGAIVAQAGLGCPVYLGDITPGHQFTGPIEDTVITCPEVDVFVCSETLEHVESPEWVLHVIRTKARRLLLSTPHGEADDRNPEHYWGWDRDDLALMLDDAGWNTVEVELYTPPVSFAYYTFQIWRCS